MVRKLFQLAVLCLLAVPAFAQQTQTKVTGTITDPNSVPYYPATVLACLTPPTQNPTVAGAAISTNPGVPYCVGPAQTGTDGTFQIPLYANSVIQCNNVACSTQWQFTVTATGTAPPAGKGAQNFQVVTTITNLTAQDVTGTLSAAAPVLLNSGGGGGSVGPGTPTNVGCFSVPTNLGDCSDPITDSGGVVTIPADLIVGRGGGAASWKMPAGAVAGCQIPTAGFNIFCSVTDGVNATFDASLDGAAYKPIATVPDVASFGAPTANVAGDCVQITADSTQQLTDAGVPCPNIPGTAPPHTFLGNGTESSGPAQLYIPIGVSDVTPNFYCVASGSTNAYVTNLTPAVTAMVQGVMVNFLPNNANTTTSPTLNVGFGGKTIVKSGGLPLVPGDLNTKQIAQVVYDGTNFQLMNPATMRSMWPCEPHFSSTDTIDFSTNPTETLFTYNCKIPANTLISGTVIHGFVGANFIGTGAAGSNATFKMYLCPTAGSLTSCKNLYTSTSSPLINTSAAAWAASMPIIIQGTQGPSATALVEQATSAGVGSNTPFGNNRIASALSNVPTNGDLFIQFSLTFQAGAATGNSMTLTSVEFF